MLLTAVIISVLTSFSSVEGWIVDGQTGKAIPFATTTLSNTSGGTTANEEGYFEFTPPPEADSLRISAIGYDERVFAVGEMPTLPVKLSPKAYLLQTASVDANRFRRRHRYGNLPESNKIVVQFVGDRRGAQFGRIFRIKREAWLKTAFISVTENTYGTARCRLRFYPVRDDSISPIPLNRQDLRFDIEGTGIIEVPLSEAGIIYTGNLLMVIELLEEPNASGKIYLGGAIFKPNGYLRAHAGEPWRKYRSSPSVGPGFVLEVVR
jgi:hypothetical protein